jgi:uncharacterized protein YndB with AHSA1/START domain
MATTTAVQMQPKSESGENLRLEITRVIKASRQRVFDAWTRPEMIRQWFGPNGKNVADTAIDARKNGEYMIAMKAGACEDMPPVEGVDLSQPSVVTGRFTRVEPYEVLAFTWKGNWNAEEETLVTIELRDVEGGTELKLTQAPFLTEQSRDGHNAGWNSSLPNLQQLLEKA